MSPKELEDVNRSFKAARASFKKKVSEFKTRLGLSQAEADRIYRGEEIEAKRSRSQNTDSKDD